MWNQVEEVKTALSNFLSDGDCWVASSEPIAISVATVLENCGVQFVRNGMTISLK